jgi:hypothetical protein
MTEPNVNPQTPGASYPAPAPPPPPVAYGPPAQPLSLPNAQLSKNAGAAGALGIIPGLGHFYLGLYQSAAILFGVFVFLISLADHSHGPFPGLFFPFWIAYSIIDAVQQARAINTTGAPVPALLGEAKPVKVSGSLTVGILLILIGGFLLLKNFVTIDLSFLNDWWPVLLVAFGAWQVFRHFKSRSAAP